MVYVISEGLHLYEECMKLADPRVADWPMMGTIFPSIGIIGVYALIVIFGPKYMKNKKPMEVTTLIVSYNFGMVLLSGYMFLEMAVCWVKLGYGFRCIPVDYSDNPYAVRLARAGWLFYLSKFVELLDTIFFIVKKKPEKMTVLHLFHHGFIPIFWWPGIKFVAGGFGAFHVIVNCFVHTVMYAYYGLAACGPAVQKYLWWKRYLTQLQLAQFLLVTIHNSQLLFVDCGYPKGYAVAIQCFTSSVAILFLNFYIKTYRSVKSRTAETEIKVQNGHIKNSTVVHKRRNHQKERNKDGDRETGTTTNGTIPRLKGE